MNIIYSKVWNRALGALVAVSELAGIRRGGTPAGTSRKRRIVPCLIALMLAGAIEPALAADAACPDAGNTDRGNEHGVDNTTCDSYANAYGYGNIASGGSSTFGSSQRDRKSVV